VRRLRGLFGLGVLAVTLGSVGALVAPACATADPVQLTLHLSTPGSVTVATADGKRVSTCRESTCAVNVDSSAPVTLTAATHNDWAFREWTSSPCGDDNPCTLTVSAATTVNAQFVPAGSWSWSSSEWLAAALLIAGTVAIVLLHRLARKGAVEAAQGGAINGIDNRWSTSKMTVVVWSYAVLFVFLVLLFRFHSRVFPGTLQDEYLVLLGIPAASALAAKGITSSKVESGDVTKPALAEPTSGTRGLFKGLAQLVTDDSGQLDLLDTQYLAFNLALLLYFLFAFFGLDIVDANTLLPNLPDSLLAISGVSAASYVAKKGLQKDDAATITVAPGSKLVLAWPATVTFKGAGTTGEIKLPAGGAVETLSTEHVATDDPWDYEPPAVKPGDGATLPTAPAAPSTALVPAAKSPALPAEVPAGAKISLPTGGSLTFTGPAGVAVPKGAEITVPESANPAEVAKVGS
jgi:hypothetical protein